MNIVHDALGMTIMQSTLGAQDALGFTIYSALGMTIYSDLGLTIVL